jgi:hypothetical protein
LGGIHTAPAPKRRRLVRGKNGQIVEQCLCRFEIGSRAFLPYKPGYVPSRFGKPLARRTNPSAESQNRDAGWTVIDVLMTATRPGLITDPGMSVMGIIDITERVRAQESFSVCRQSLHMPRGCQYSAS